jgi:hypothetical protein
MHFPVDYNKLYDSIDPKKKSFKFSEVKHKLIKVAFDVFRMKDGDPEELWQIQNSDDGDYIVARYENVEPKVVAAQTQWTACTTKTCDGVNIFYKGRNIAKIASSNDIDVIAEFLPGKLETDKSFVKALLNTLDKDTRSELLRTYPELN